MFQVSVEASCGDVLRLTDSLFVTESSESSGAIIRVCSKQLNNTLNDFGVPCMKARVLAVAIYKDLQSRLERTCHFFRHIAKCIGEQKSILQLVLTSALEFCRGDFQII